MQRVFDAIPWRLETLIALAILIIGLSLWELRYRRRSQRQRTRRFYHHLTMVGLTLMGLIGVILTLDEPAQGQLLTLFGVLLSGAIAFSSTTLLANGIAGLMMRAQRQFRAGDYVKVGDEFGRVVDRGLFFTEIQNEFKDLVTVPNNMLSTRPVTVINPEGTVICAEVSLGYDVPRKRIKELMLGAAEEAGLNDSFVQTLELGDFSVRYRVCGLLKQLDGLLTARSLLKGRVLDALHHGGVEIVSPAFMNQRVVDPSRVFIPAPDHTPEAEPDVELEAVVFDRAEVAASAERARDLTTAVEERIERLRRRARETEEPERREEIESGLQRLEELKVSLAEQVERSREGQDTKP